MAGQPMHEFRSSRTDESCYNHQPSMEQALARALPTARDRVAAVLAVVGAWRPRRMVDMGAGPGAMLRLFAEITFAQEYAAADVSQLSVDFLNRTPFPGFVGATRASVDQPPWEDQSFDLATAAHVLEHVVDPVIALQEIARIATKVCIELPLELALLPKAKAVLVNLAHGRVPVNTMKHLHFFSVRGVRDLVRTAGLRIEAEYRYRVGFEWLSMNYGKNSLNCRIRQALGSVLPIGLYGALLSTNLVVLCSRPSSPNGAGG